MVPPPPEMLQVLHRMARLMADDVFEEWAATLSTMAEKGWRTSDEGRRAVRALYGGMGSLSDVVLQKDGKPHVAENDEFDRLRERLLRLSLDL